MFHKLYSQDLFAFVQWFGKIDLRVTWPDLWDVCRKQIDDVLMIGIDFIDPFNRWVSVFSYMAARLIIIESGFSLNHSQTGATASCASSFSPIIILN